MAQAGVVQLGDFRLGKILTKKARFLPLLVVSLLERRRDEHPPGFEESKAGHLFRKLTEMVQRICSLYVKGKVCLSLLAAALTLPRRKLPGQGFFNFSSCRQSCFLP